MQLTNRAAMPARNASDGCPRPGTLTIKLTRAELIDAIRLFAAAHGADLPRTDTIQLRASTDGASLTLAHDAASWETLLLDPIE